MHNAFHSARTAEYEANFGQETYREKVNQFKLQGLETTAKIALTKAQIGLTDAQIEKYSNEIGAMWEELRLKNKEVNIKDFEASLKKMPKNVEETIMRTLLHAHDFKD